MNTKSKKDLLMLGLLGIGAIALASQVADIDTTKDKKFRLGGKGLTPISIKKPIAPAVSATNIYMLPGQGEVTFPSVPSFDINSMIAKTAKFIDSSGGRPTEIYPNDYNVPVVSRRRITSAYERIRSSGYDPTVTFTGTNETPAFVERDIYHKKMVKELGL